MRTSRVIGNQPSHSRTRVVDNSHRDTELCSDLRARRVEATGVGDDQIRAAVSQLPQNRPNIVIAETIGYLNLNTKCRSSSNGTINALLVPTEIVTFLRRSNSNLENLTTPSCSRRSRRCYRFVSNFRLSIIATACSK